MGDFRKNLITLVSGAGVTQLIPLLLAPVLARLYAPADFGLLALLMSIVGILGAVVSGRFELAIMHARGSSELRNLLFLPVLATAVGSLFFGGIMAVFHNQLAALFQKPALADWLIWGGIPLFCAGIVQTCTIYLSRKKEYRTVVTGRISQNLITGAVSISCALVVSNGNGLAFGYVVGMLVIVIYFVKRVSWSLQGVSLSRLGALAKKYRQYILFSAPAALLDAATQSVPIFIIGAFYHAGVLGYFSQANRLLAVPLVLIGASVSQAFFQHAAEQRRERSPLMPLLYQTTKKLLLYSLPFFLIFMIIAPTAFRVAFGENWMVAGEYARLVAIGYWVRLGVSPISQIFFVVQRVKLGSSWQLLYFLTSSSIFFMAAKQNISIDNFLIVFALHEILLYTIYFMMARSACRQDDINRFSIAA
jgi:O-antigen/teichoic acid export membrane protein